MLQLLLAVALLLGGAPPSDQLLVYYNARIALREGRADEAVKLWLLRNAIEHRTGQVSGRDDDLRSVTWAALGQLGLCPDGFPHDDDGAGLWPLALHNWLVRTIRQPAPSDGASPFSAFELGRQQRHVSLSDVLDATELSALQLHSSGCLAGRALRLSAGESPLGDPSDRPVTARLLRYLLREALHTLRGEQVGGRAVIAARIFDLDLQLAELAARARRRAQREARREGRQRGISRAELAEHEASEPRPLLAPDSEEGRILAASLAWPPEAWLALTADRRQFLFAYAARTFPGDPRLRPLTLGILDRLVETRRGQEVQSFVGHLTAGADPAARRLVWEGERGLRLLGLDRESGFGERGVIALHRGVGQLAAGQLPEALGSLAHALSWAEESRAGDAVRSLARRWLSFVAAQFRVTDELFTMLRAVVPRADYAVVLEDQLWHAALGADAGSFARCVRHRQGRSALDQRIALLTPLASGDAGAFVAGVATSLTASPYFTHRLLRLYVERLQAEDAEVRGRHGPTLLRLVRLLEQGREAAGASAAREHGLETLLGQLRATLDGLPQPVGAGSSGDGAEAADPAYALAPGRELFAGSVRVAPVDPLPWPFAPAEVGPPAVFTPLALVPEERRDGSGRLLFGWRISD